MMVYVLSRQRDGQQIERLLFRRVYVLYERPTERTQAQTGN